MSVSMEEFGKLQMGMMELKQEKMVLEDSSKRQHAAAESAMSMYQESEKQLAKANKAIAKSKKTKELQAILQKHDEEMEQLTVQNTGLMDNLAELSMSNEKLEKRLRRSSITSIETPTPELKGVVAKCEELENEISTFQDNEKKFKAKISKLQKEATASQAKYALLLTGDGGDANDMDVATEGDGNERINKLVRANKEFVQLSEESEQRLSEATQKIEELETKLQSAQSATTSSKPPRAATGASDKEKEYRLQLKELNAKIKKKQSSYVAVQEEKEKIYSELTQLKEKILKEAENREPAEQEIIVSQLKEQLAKEKTQNDTLVVEIETLAVARARKAAEATESSSELTEIRTGYEQAATELSDLRKVAESRKDLLNSQANEKQEMIEKHNAKYAELEKESTTETAGLKQSLEMLTASISKSKKDLIKIPKLQEELKTFKEKVAELQTKLETTQSEFEAFKASSLESEASANTLSESVIQGLKTQADQLQEDVKVKEEALELAKTVGSSAQSDRAIVDRKGAAMIKDLKKQLRQEQKRVAQLEDDLTNTASTDTPNTPVRGHSRTKSGQSVRSMGLPLESNMTKSHGGSQDSLTSMRSITSARAQNTPPQVQTQNEAPLISENEHVQLIQRLTTMQTEKAELAEKVKFLSNKVKKISVELETKTELVMQYATKGMSTETVKEKDSGPSLLGKRMGLSKKKPANNAMADANSKMHVLLEETLMKNIQLQNMVEMLQKENSGNTTPIKPKSQSPSHSDFETTGSPNIEHELTTKM